MKIIDRVNMVTLGCSKNLVDSEVLMSQLKRAGFKIRHNSNEGGEIVVINTCGFIGDAKEESIDTILSFVDARKRGDVSKLYVMGCLTERYREELEESIPEIDKIYGKFDWKEIVTDLGGEYQADHKTERLLTTPSHYAYLKISEGCDRTCSYCAIPLITGKHKSRSIEDIIQEAQSLVSQGVKEIQLIAQDLTYYGLDLYKENKLAVLVDKISDIEGLEWLRLHYAYPNHFPYDLLPVMQKKNNVCAYLDIALQHISDKMLKLMRRNTTKSHTIDIIKRIRQEVPGIHLRTTLLVGHPGETEEDFQELMDFVADMKFERLGVFPYSNEDQTYAFNNYKDDVLQEVKMDRFNKVMELQQQISRDLNQTKIGSTLSVMIDRKEGDFYIGRTEYDSPEVDPEVLIENDTVLQIGSIYQVQITQAEDYDLYGKITQ